MSDGFLSDTQRETLEAGEEIEYNSDRSRIRRRFAESVTEANLVIENQNLVDPAPRTTGEKKTLDDYTSPDEIERLMINLLRLLDDTEVRERCTTGRKQRVAAAVFLAAFGGYEWGETEDGRKPHPSKIDGFQEVVDLINSFYE